MKRHKRFGVMALAAVVLTATACVGSGSIAMAETAAEEGQQNSFSGTIRILHLNDVHSYVEETDTAIGYAKLAAYIRQVKAENPNTIVLDAGDTMAGTASSAFNKGESLPAILNTIGFDAMALGNADFSYGKDPLDKFINALDYPVLCGNMPLVDGTQVYQGSTILELDGGLKAGIVSVTTPESMRNVQGVFDYQNASEVCKTLVDEIRPQVDIVIALVHLGDAESEEMTSDRIAKEVPGIDVIIDGHSHTVLEEGKRVNGVLITQAGEYSKYLGEINLQIENGVIVDADAHLLTKAQFAEAPEKEDTKAAVSDLVKKRDAYFAQVIGQTTVELVGTRELVRTQETNVGNLFADAVKAAAGSDIAILPAGIIGGELKPGNITRGDVLNIGRVNSDVINKEMTGSDILTLVNHALASYPEPAAGYIQVSGLTIVFDPSLPGDRVVSIQINGAELEAERTYVVAMVTGMSTNPGAVNGKTVKEVGETTDILEAYIMQNTPVAPVTEGRITVK